MDRPTMEARFLEKVNKTATCWLLKSNGTSYGKFYLYKKVVSFHRASYLLWKGEIPTGLVVRHTCDNKRCVNPEHLILGTSKENTADMLNRNRHAYGEKQGLSKLTDDDVREIKILFGFGFSLNELARLYGVDKTNISQIKRGNIWKHITS